MKHTRKTITSLLLMIIMLVQIIPFSAVTVSAETIPIDAIHISTAEELAAIGGEQSAGKYYVLDNDINLTSEWTPIDNFQGTFDGQGYAVNNLYVLASSNRKYVGLFGSINNATVKNVGINIASQGISASSDFSSFAGGLIGDAWYSTIMNCYVIGGMISAYSSQNYMGGSSSFAGMLIGFAYHNIITNCYVTGDVSASVFNSSSLGVNVGGLIGKNDLQSNIITSCYRLYNQTILGANIDESGIPLTPEQMRIQSSFIGWDFNTVWDYQSGVNNDYPILRIGGSGGNSNVAVTGVSLSKQSTTIEVGNSETLTAYIYPTNATNQNITWSSSNPNIASVNNGVVTGVSAGTTTITVTTEDGGYTSDCVVSVINEPVSPTISTENLPNGTVGMLYGKTLTATGDTPITWSIESGNLPNGLILSSSGVISGMPTTVGTFWFYIRAANSVGTDIKELSITVTGDTAGGVEISPKTLTLDIWESYILTATVSPDNAINKNVTWSSSNSNIVSVYSNGQIIAKAVGTATVTATTEDGGYTDTCTITVTAIYEDDESYRWEDYPDDPDYDYWDGLDWQDNPVEAEYWNDETWFDKETDDVRDIPSPCEDDGTHILTSSDIKRYTVLVLDISGSMKGKPLAELKKASKEFCDYIIKADSGNYISIVAYSSKAKIKQHFTNDYQELANVIDSLKSGGSTNICDGLASAERLLDSVIANNGAVKQIFLMSDGLPNTGLRADTTKYSKFDYYNYRYANAVFNKANELKSYGYQILTLGFFHAKTQSEFVQKRLRFATQFMNEDLPSDEYRNAISIVNTPNDLIERFKLAAQMLSVSTLSNDNKILIENKLSQIPCDTPPTTEPTTQPTTTQSHTQPTTPNPPPPPPTNPEPTMPTTTKPPIYTTTKSTPPITTTKSTASTTVEPTTSMTIEPTISTTIEPTTSMTIEPTISTTIEPTTSTTIEPTISTTIETTTSTTIEQILLIEDTTPTITEPTTTTITETENNTIRGDDNFYSIDDNGNLYISENASDIANIYIIDDDKKYYPVIHINDDEVIYVIDDNENYYRIDNTTKQFIHVDDRNDDYLYEIVKMSVLNNEILPKSGKFYLPLQLLIAVGVLGLSMLYLAIFRFKGERKLKRKPRMVILCVGVLSILSSTGVAAYGYFDDSRADTAVSQTIQILHEQIEQIQEHQENVEEDIDNTPKLIEINGESYIGTLKIPSLNLELPVNNKWNDEIMKNSPCRYMGDISSSMIIVAHNYKAHFGQIQNLLFGDKLVITDGNGGEHWYTVELTTILHETEIDAMINNPYDLTLFTCTLDRKHRITVRCNKINDKNTEIDNKIEEIIQINEETPQANIEISNISVNYPVFQDYDIKIGQKGYNVKLIQQYLNEIRSIQPTIPYLEEDGSFGPATDNAVKIFQKLYDLSVDGIVGQYTWSKMVEIYDSLQ